MKRIIYGVVGLFVILGFWVSHVSAQGGVSLGAKIGTTGYGLEAAVGMTEHLNVRGGVSMFDFEVTYTTDDRDPDVKFDLDAENRAYHLFVDYLPFKRILRLTGGIVYQGPRFMGTGTPVENYTDPESGLTFTPAQMGRVELDLYYQEKVNPYLGFGFGNSLNNLVTLSFDAGLIFSGKPTVDSRTFGKMAELVDYDPAVIERDAQKVTVWPVVRFGVAVRLIK